MKIALFATLLLLPGCASMMSPQTMSADQLKALVSDKNGTAVCTTVIGPWGTAKIVVVNLDEVNTVNGNVTVDDKCSVAITTTKAALQKPVTP